MTIAHGAGSSALALAVSILCMPAHADTSYVTVRLDKPLINQVDDRTFGVGTMFIDDLVRRSFIQEELYVAPERRVNGKAYEDPAPLRTQFDELNPGLMRFPDGTGTLHYYWNFPCASSDEFTPGGGTNRSNYWTPEEVYRRFTLKDDPDEKMLDGRKLPDIIEYTSTNVREGLGAQLVLQINTFGAAVGRKTANGYEPLACTGPGGVGPVFVNTIAQKNPDAPLEDDANDDPDRHADGRYKIKAAGLTIVAEMAGEWLRSNRRFITWENGAIVRYSAVPGTTPVKYQRNPLGTVTDRGVRMEAQQADYWEIGNEDWDTWKPDDYAVKFAAIVQQMKTVEKSLPALPEGRSYKPLRFIAQVMPGPWLTTFSSKLKALAVACGVGPNCINLNDVHAVTVHPYDTGDHDVVLNNRFGALSAKADAASHVADIKRRIANLRASENGPTTGWDIWATEYNQNENAVFNHWRVLGDKAKMDHVSTTYYNNKLHGVYMADITGRLLEMGVKKLFPFGASTSSQWGLFNYANGGSTFWQPRWMPAGLVIKKLINDFKGDMYPVTLSTPSLSVTSTEENLGPDVSQDGDRQRGYNFRSLTAYSSLGADGKLRMMLVNRNVNSAASVLLQVTGRQFDTSAQHKFEELTGLPTDSNYVADFVTGQLPPTNAPLPVQWGAASLRATTQSCSATQCVLTKPLTVQKGSVVFLTLQTKPR